MSEGVLIELDERRRRSGRSAHEKAHEQVTFDRRELDAILRVYGFKVGAGEWRDYAIDFGRERAVFSVYARASEAPLYRIGKEPKLARRQGAYSVTAQQGHIIKRGQDLAQVLRVFEKRLKLVE